MNLFDFFYRWKSFYGEALYEHLKGWDDAMMGYNPNYNQFPALFLWTVGIAIIVFLLYYYIINSPRLTKWWHWMLSLVIVGVAAFGVAYHTVDVDVINNNIAVSLQPYIGANSALMLGIYNFLLAVLFYFVFTLLFRRWSKNCKHSPWVLLTTKLNNKRK